MKEQDIKSAYTLALHRDPENNAAWQYWVGRPFADFANQTIGSAEWLTENDVLLRAYPELQKHVADLQAEIDQSQLSDKSKQIIADMQAVIAKYGGAN